VILCTVVHFQPAMIIHIGPGTKRFEVVLMTKDSCVNIVSCHQLDNVDHNFLFFQND
jgi:hypothetical protein